MCFREGKEPKQVTEQRTFTYQDAQVLVPHMLGECVPIVGEWHGACLRVCIRYMPEALVWLSAIVLYQGMFAGNVLSDMHTWTLSNDIRVTVQGRRVELVYLMYLREEFQPLSAVLQTAVRSPISERLMQFNSSGYHHSCVISRDIYPASMPLISV